jgi:hypothetical protein
LFAPENIPNIVLAAIGIIGIVVAICTLRIIQRQTSHIARQAQNMRYQTTHLRNSVVQARKAANAALLGAQAVINSERPWLVVDIVIDENKPALYVVRVINKGRTPAEMQEGHCRFTVEKVGGFTPPFNFEGPFIAPLQGLTVSEDSFEICKIDPVFMLEQAGEAPFPVSVYVYGRITYWDTFTDRTRPDAKAHETRWCFSYQSYTKRWYRSANGYAKYT